ncbi:MAG: Hsp20/alpha crystallin family protein [Saprospiraceae bacterium]|nr:Hsp20/alpha crystallin family protein [Saprospiraceae bacterium]
MTLVKFQPAPSPFRSLFNEFFNTSMDEFLPSSRVPAVNVVETDKGFRLELVAPGFEKGDFQIALDKNVLTVSAKKESENEETTEKYRRREYQFSSFERSFNLPETLDQDSVKATYQNGVLHLELTKKAPAVNPVKSIAVN